MKNEKDLTFDAYPSNDQNETSKPQMPTKSKSSLPCNAVLKNEPKQAWNANLQGKVSGKAAVPRPTKKYRHYPVSCDFCDKKFQPGDLTKHIVKEHPEERLESSVRGKNTSSEEDKSENAKETRKPKKKKIGGPRHFKICYICGRPYGSLSLKIHEPKCLEKWRIENEKLPKNKQMPEPIKPNLNKGLDSEIKLSGTGGCKEFRNIPDLDPEAEAAYQSHLLTLVPCEFCQRTFNPDRVMVHEKVCINRPKRNEQE